MAHFFLLRTFNVKFNEFPRQNGLSIFLQKEALRSESVNKMKIFIIIERIKVDS